MTTQNPLADKSATKIATVAESILNDFDADEIDALVMEGYDPTVGGYVSSYRLGNLRKEVTERMGDAWTVNVSHEVEETNEAMVSIEKVAQ